MKIELLFNKLIRIIMLLIFSFPLPFSYAEERSEVEAAEIERGTVIENIYLIQSDILLADTNQTDEDLLVELATRTYEPYEDFWSKYCCKNHETFEYVTQKGLNKLKQTISKRLPELNSSSFMVALENSSNKLFEMTGRRPQGTWYLLFGPGITDLGAIGGNDMVIDFSHPHTKVDDIEILLPHELAHLIVNTGELDPYQGTILKRVIDEGFGTYVGYIFHGEKYSVADNLFYKEEEWRWALENEKELLNRFKKEMFLKDKAIENQYATRNHTFANGAPGAIDYFIGFRIVQAYVEKHGENSWKDIFDMSSREIWEKSEYKRFVELQ